VGPSLSRDLTELGYGRVEDLRGENPEEMYHRLERIRGVEQDRCVLYVFRCAVYFASTPNPDPELLKWWAWKGRDSPSSEGESASASPAGPEGGPA